MVLYTNACLWLRELWFIDIIVHDIISTIGIRYENDKRCCFASGCGHEILRTANDSSHHM